MRISGGLRSSIQKQESFTHLGLRRSNQDNHRRKGERTADPAIPESLRQARNIRWFSVASAPPPAAWPVVGYGAPRQLELIRRSGVLAAEDVRVSSNVAGRLVELRVREGDLVRRNDLLARIAFRSQRGYSEPPLRTAVAGATGHQRTWSEWW